MSEMARTGYPLLYVDADLGLRRLADGTFGDGYIVESVASGEDLGGDIEPAVTVINLSDTADPKPVWDQLTHRWPTVNDLRSQQWWC